jgi:hypothetical protein
MTANHSDTGESATARMEAPAPVDRRGWIGRMGLAFAGGVAVLAGRGMAEGAQESSANAKRTAGANTLDVLAAKEEIREVIYTYSRGLDRMDKELANSIWNPGATADYPNQKGTGPEIIDGIWNYHNTITSHSHQMVNILIKVTGDTAVSETYGSVSLLAVSGGKSVTTLIRNRYVDRWSRRNGKWRIDHRQLIVDFRDDHETPKVVSSGQGRRDKSDPSYVMFGR